VLVSQQGGFTHGETLTYPGLEVHETAAPPRRSPETPASSLASRQVEDGDPGQSPLLWSWSPCVQSQLNRATQDSYTRCHRHTDIARLHVLPVCQCCVARFRSKQSPWHSIPSCRDREMHIIRSPIAVDCSPAPFPLQSVTSTGMPPLPGAALPSVRLTSHTPGIADCRKVALEVHDRKIVQEENASP
jgi:hypothetical protein